MSRLLLAALLAQAVPDAGVTGVEQLYTACGDAPLMQPVDGGYLVPERRQQHNNCKLAACENYATAKLAEEPTASPGLVVGLVGGGVLVAVIAAVVAYFVPHPPAK